MTDQEKINKGGDLNEPAFWDNKREVRISLRIPSNDLRLKQWSTWAKQNHVDQQWYQALTISGGSKHRTWWLYRGVIPPERFKTIEILNGEIDGDERNPADPEGPG